MKRGGAGSHADNEKADSGSLCSGSSAGGNCFPCRKLGHWSASPGEIPEQEFLFSLTDSVNSSQAKGLKFCHLKQMLDVR